MSDTELVLRNDMRPEPGSWNQWARFIVHEIHRFANEMSKMEIEIKALTKETTELQKEFIQHSSSNTTQHDIQSLSDTVQELKNTNEEMKKKILELEKFKIRTVTVLGTLNFLLGTGIAIAALF